MWPCSPLNQLVPFSTPSALPSPHQWIRSFLSNRSQKVKIGECISRKEKLVCGVPQGGILSPIIFVLYVSDLEDWLNHSSAFTYADDTSTSISDTDVLKVIRKMEEDANQVLKYMASNGLIANTKKTAMLFLNNRDKDQTPIQIHIGSEMVTQEQSAKLLGVTFNAKQKWNDHIHGTGGLLSSLNQRLFLIKRLKNFLNQKALCKVAESIFMSKVRYGLQLMGKVRLSEEDPKNIDLWAIQKAQNKLVRLLAGSRLNDRVSTKSLLDKFAMLSVNQMHAQIKLTEMWKIVHTDDHPIKVESRTQASGAAVTRSADTPILLEKGKSDLSQRTFINNAAHIWK